MIKKILFGLSLLLIGTGVFAQSILNRTISLRLNNLKLGQVLGMIEQKGSFRFSYNSSILPIDSMVSFSAEHITVEEALNGLLNSRFEYKEAHNFVVIRYAPYELSMVVEESYGNQELYTVSGQIIDKYTGRPVKNASVYEKNLIVSTLSDERGLFTLKLKNISKTIALTVTKENYKELTSYFLSEVRISSRKRGIRGEWGYDEYADSLSDIERTRLGRWFITRRQMIQSVNLRGLIANAPVQASLTPGLSSHGSLSGQIVNKFSLNVTGGYNGGVDGVEIGLLFNIDKKDVRWLQIAGAFNMAGGRTEGVQIGGFHNHVLDSVSGVQITLGYNRVARHFSGIQIGGLYNQVKEGFNGVQISSGYNRVKGSFGGVQIGALNRTDTLMSGIQIAPLANITTGRASGIQIGGLLNYSRSFSGLSISALTNIAVESRGLQISGVFNYARKLKGMQIGLVNIADTSSGYSIGLINIVKKGYHKLGVGTNEITDLNAAIKSGNTKLYTLLTGGMNLDDTNKLYSLGFGFGTERKLIMNRLSVNPEISAQYLYQGNWRSLNLLNKFDLNFNLRFTRWLALQAGPSFNVYYSDQLQRRSGFDFVNDRKGSIDFDNPKLKGWFGWNAGLVAF